MADSEKKFKKVLKDLEEAGSELVTADEVAQIFNALILQIKDFKKLVAGALSEIGDKWKGDFKNLFKEATQEIEGKWSKFSSDVEARLRVTERKVSNAVDAKYVTDRLKLFPMIKEVEDMIAESHDDEAVIQEAVDRATANTTMSAEQVVEKVNESETLIRKEQVEGINEFLKQVRESNPKVPFFGTSRGIQLYVDSEKKGLVQFLDIVPGPGMTITDSVVNGLHTLTFSSTGGSGFTQLDATETPNGNLTTFTFADASAQPSFLVVDNVWMKATTATGSTNWTWDSGAKQATLSIPASDDIWAVI